MSPGLTLYRNAFMLTHIDNLPVNQAHLRETDLAKAVAELSQFVLQMWERNWPAAKSYVRHSPRNVINNIRRKCGGSLRQAQSALVGSIAKTNARGFIADVQAGMALRNSWTAQLAWGLFVSRPPQTPLMDPDPDSIKIIQEEGGDGFVMAELRRIMHNHFVYVILSEPALGHLIGRVGEKNAKGSIQVFGNFSDFAYDVCDSRPCMLWMAKIYDNPKMQQCWHKLQRQIEDPPGNDMLLWEAGRRVAVESFSNDGRKLTLHGGNQEEFPQYMQFEKRDWVYMVLFQPTHQVMFQYNTLETGWRKRHGAFNTVTRKLFGLSTQENLLTNLGQGRWGEE